MKIKLLILSVLLNLGVESLAQTEETGFLNDGLQISLGYGIHSNSLIGIIILR